MKNNDYNLNDESNFPLDNNGKNAFDLPADYFSKFEDKLKRKMELENELSEFPVLSSIQKTNVFTEPANYFQSIENSLEYKTELASYPKLEVVKKPAFSDLTEEYKQQFQLALNYKVELAEELNAYQTLYTIDKVNPFVVSADYFESVGERVKDRIYSANETKISALTTILDFIFGKKLALSFILVLAIGASFYFNQTSEIIPEETTGDCKTLACLERQEILNNKAITNFDEDQLIDMVDVNKLNEQLNSKKETSATSAGSVTTATKSGKENNQTINLDSVNEDDLLDQL